MGHEPELKFWMKFRMKYCMTGFETFDFFAWFFQYLDIQFQAHAEKLLIIREEPYGTKSRGEGLRGKF